MATSVASARVGRGVSVIVSTTLVTTTGLPPALHLKRTIFWDKKTFSGGMSKPKFPRERMTPSAAATISSTFRNAASRSTFAKTFVPGIPASASNSLHSRIAAASGVNDTDTKSTSFGAAHSFTTRRSHSLSVGMSSPCLFATCTVSSTPLSFASLRAVHVTVPAFASTSSTLRYTDDVSEPVKRYCPTKMSSPGCTKFTSSGVFTGRNAALAGTVASVVSVTLFPCVITTGALGAFASNDVTSLGASSIPISGPRVSSIVAHKIFVRLCASLRFSSVFVWYAIEPQEKSKRAMFIPASRSAMSSSTVRLFTPTVQITFVSEETVPESSLASTMRPRPDACDGDACSAPTDF